MKLARYSVSMEKSTIVKAFVAVALMSELSLAVGVIPEVTLLEEEPVLEFDRENTRFKHAVASGDVAGAKACLEENLEFADDFFTLCHDVLVDQKDAVRAHLVDIAALRGDEKMLLFLAQELRMRKIIYTPSIFFALKFKRLGLAQDILERVLRNPDLREPLLGRPRLRGWELNVIDTAAREENGTFVALVLQFIAEHPEAAKWFHYEDPAFSRTRNETQLSNANEEDQLVRSLLNRRMLASELQGDW